MQNPPFDWASTREALRDRLGSEAVGRWLDPLTVSSVTEHTLILEAPNPFFRDWVASHYLLALKPYVSGRELRVIAAVSTGAASTGSAPTARATPEIAEKAAAGRWTVAEKRLLPPGGQHGLNPKFTFEGFVVGPSNRFAHAASLAVAESPAKAYNPLFFYGGVGLGKTHLMQAVGQAILQRWPERKVVYISSECFTNELITAIQTRTTARFRERYRTVDILLIDDIHFIAEKEATQEEFFHTFNALYDAHRQIVLSSDRSPKQISGLEERLVSRFEWGLVTDVQPPDLETRIAILRKKAEEAAVEVPESVTNFIAQQITSNIRELEGALIRVTAYCAFYARAASEEVAREVLKDMVVEVRSRVTIQEVQRAAAEYFELAVGELCGLRRQRSVLYPRQVAMYLARHLTEASLPEIGRAFGGRDHTTVLHAVGKIEREIAQDSHKKYTVEQLQQRLLASSRSYA